MVDLFLFGKGFFVCQALVANTKGGEVNRRLLIHLGVALSAAVTVGLPTLACKGRPILEPEPDQPIPPDVELLLAATGFYQGRVNRAMTMLEALTALGLDLVVRRHNVPYGGGRPFVASINSYSGSGWTIYVDGTWVLTDVGVGLWPGAVWTCRAI